MVGRENVTPFEREELLDSLLSSGKGAELASEDMDTVAVVTAVVGLGGLMDGVNGELSGRTVTTELAEILRLLSFSAAVVDTVLLRVIRVSEGSVGSEGGTAKAGSARRSGRAAWDCLERGVGEGS